MTMLLVTLVCTKQSNLNDLKNAFVKKFSGIQKETLPLKYGINSHTRRLRLF